MKPLKSAYNLLLSAAIVVAVGACSSTTEPRGELRASLTGEQEYRVQPGVEIPEREPSLVVRSGGFDVAARFTLPTPCYELRSAVVREGDVVSVVVTAWADLPSGGGCIQVVTLRDYDVAVRGLEPGRYTVRVVHALAHMSDMGTVVLQRQVDVP